MIKMTTLTVEQAKTSKAHGPSSGVYRILNIKILGPNYQRLHQLWFEMQKWLKSSGFVVRMFLSLMQNANKFIE